MSLQAEGSFGHADGGAKNAGLSGRGALTFDGASGWHFVCRRAHGGLRIPMALVGAAAGVLLTAIGATLLEEVGLDLMRYRKGPVLVGMVGLFVAIGGWAGMAWLADKMFGRAHTKTLGPGQSVAVRQHSRNAKGVSLYWSEGDKTVGTTFKPADEGLRSQLLSLRG
jgi:hypothetical protein